MLSVTKIRPTLRKEGSQHIRKLIRLKKHLRKIYRLNEHPRKTY